jgi:hypothetical protein
VAQLRAGKGDGVTARRFGVAKLVAACLLCIAVFAALTLLVLHFRGS